MKERDSTWDSLMTACQGVNPEHDFKSACGSLIHTGATEPKVKARQRAWRNVRHTTTNQISGETKCYRKYIYKSAVHSLILMIQWRKRKTLNMTKMSQPCVFLKLCDKEENISEQ